MRIALEVDSVEEVARRISEYLEMRMPEGLLGKLKMLPKLAEVGAFFPKDRLRRAVQGSDPARQFFARRVSDPAVLAGGRRPIHHAADGIFEKSRHRQAQLRLLPAAGVRRPHHRHALADPQTGRRALSAAGEGRQTGAHGCGGGDRLGPGHDVFGDSAAAARSRRNDDRRIPARRSRWRW